MFDHELNSLNDKKCSNLKNKKQVKGLKSAKDCKIRQNHAKQLVEMHKGNHFLHYYMDETVHGI